MFVQRLRQFMMTHAGFDAYSLFLLMVFVFLRAVVATTQVYILAILVYGLLAYVIFRIVSKNPQKRQMENQRFLSMLQHMGQWMRFKSVAHQDKSYRYFKCPNCGTPLRAPKKLGKIHVSCRSCGLQFDKKT